MGRNRSRVSKQRETKSLRAFLQPFWAQRSPSDPVLPGATQAELTACERALGIPLPTPLRALLTGHNGGLWRGGLLHLLGAHRPLRQDDLASWNDPALWKYQYRHLDLAGYIFFADDAFGNLFGFVPGEDDPAVWRFDIQEGELLQVAESITAFFQEVLPTEGPWLLGEDFLQAYRESGRPWEPGQHLALRTPALLGGDMEPENLLPLAPLANLIVAGQIVTQIKPLPAGTQVKGFTVDLQTLTVTVRV